MWFYDTSGDGERPVALYDCQPSRAGVCASRFLEGFSEQKFSCQERRQNMRIIHVKKHVWRGADLCRDQKAWLMDVFLDGGPELSSNRAERAVRPFAVGRKNWLFSNTPKGADASAAVCSIVEAAKANGLRLYRYLKFLWRDAVKYLCIISEYKIRK